MYIEIVLKSGQILHFKENPNNYCTFDDLYCCAIKNGRMIVLPCTNGDFLLNPTHISYAHIAPDEPLERDER